MSSGRNSTSMVPTRSNFSPSKAVVGITSGSMAGDLAANSSGSQTALPPSFDRREFRNPQKPRFLQHGRNDSGSAPPGSTGRRGVRPRPEWPWHGRPKCRCHRPALRLNRAGRSWRYPANSQRRRVSSERRNAGGRRRCGHRRKQSGQGPAPALAWSMSMSRLSLSRLPLPILTPDGQPGRQIADRR